MMQRLSEMGPLRNLLHGTAALFALLTLFARAPGYSGAWEVFFTGVLPATAPIIVIVIGLDIMMSSVWRSDAMATADTARAQRFTRIIRAHYLFGGVLLGVWLAVFLPVLL